MRIIIALFCASVAFSATAQKLLPIEAYGSLPRDSLVALSPDGTRYAKRMVQGGRDVIVAVDVATNEFVKAVNAEEVKPTSIQFLTNDTLLLKAGATTSERWVQNAYEHTSAYEFNLESGDVNVLLRNATDLYPYQSGLGRVLGLSDDGDALFMPAFMFDNRGSRTGAPTYGFYEVRFGDRRERVRERGSENTIDWFVDDQGKPIIREDFNDGRNEYRLWRYTDGKRELLYSEDDVESAALSIVGIMPSREALVIREEADNEDVDNYYAMSIEDGTVSGPILGRDDVDIQHVITDENRVVIGARYAGFKPSYQFLDPELDARVRGIQERFGDISVSLVDWSADFKRLLFHLSGSITAGSYVIMEDVDSRPIPVAVSRPDMSAENIAHVIISEYPARDGLTIPMLVTGTADVINRGNAPLIVLPHGGPASHDSYRFDWRAQYFASRGYIVLQPQFRGSTGFGEAHRAAGFGEWGRKMQTDLDDGVQVLVDEQIVDPDRVCIVGSSYGGYAALAAGAFSPFPYRCVVSLNGVTDLVEQLQQERREHGRRSAVLDYWERQMGGSLQEKEQLEEISPAMHADKFRAPVLLIHGKDDTIVLPEQSRRMQRALKKANKAVTYEILKGEDHWLREAETRMRSLELMSDFIEKHNPAD
ncbi:MAG: alpha/beta fold hydrolase [Pseudomonadota bacterium]